MVKNLWNLEQASKLKPGLDELVYRSNLIGSEREVCNWGGGNTSMKTIGKDFHGRDVEVIWIKGSGSDLATMNAMNFTGLRLTDIKPLLERNEMSDEEMVNYLEHCKIDNKHPRASIETLLHAFLPFNHIDHTHPDAIISICCADNGFRTAKEIFGNRFVWVPYVRPGFMLSKMIAEKVKKNPDAELVLMEKHGLVVWGDTSEQCYEKTIAVINEAERYIQEKMNNITIFGGQKFKTLSKMKRQTLLGEVLPVIRGEVSKEQKMILTYDDTEDVLQFVNSFQANELSKVGAACPDHLVHTKRTPLYIDWNPETEDTDNLIRKVRDGVNEYQKQYSDYFEQNANEGDKIFEPAPRVILIPGIGMVNTGKTLMMSRVSGALYCRAIAVMKGATAIGKFISLNENESYNIEYWPLELYKLSLAPPEKEFSGSVALITGGAGGIGSETARLLIQEGAHVIIADYNFEEAQRVANDINEQYGEDRAFPVYLDVRKEESVRAAFKQANLVFGGIDVIVNNAGISTSNSIEDTTLEEWNLNVDVLGTGYFLVAREAFKQLKVQGIGGSMVFVGSKNALYAGKNAAAYSSVKALEVHLARCIAAEGGEFGIRVNSVLPDAVLQGSKIWNSSWRQERAKTYGIEPNELEEHYRKRTTLSVNIYPSNIAEAIVFFASSKAAKTTGCMITVDGGIPAAFVR